MSKILINDDLRAFYIIYKKIDRIRDYVRFFIVKKRRFFMAKRKVNNSKKLYCNRCRTSIVYPLKYSKQRNQCYRCGGILSERRN